jgi:glycosyltransferase involved in cell wall biosynthesis
MLTVSTSSARSRGEAASLLVVSGVDISQAPSPGGDMPRPDYRALIDVLDPDVLDVGNVHEIRHPAVAAVRSKLGLHWSIALAATLSARHYQAIVATGEDVGLPLALLLKLSRRRVPLIVICHNIATRRPATLLGKLKVGSAVRQFLCLSRAQARILTERFHVRPEQIAMLYWHVDHQFFRPMPNVAPRNQICSAGMASRDYATLLAAARGLDVDVKIAADSPWFKQRLNITEEDLSERVEVRSYGTYAALRELYAESRFVVVPLHDVPFSAGYTVILEAMAMGKAVIVSRIAQQDDFVVDGQNGLYVEPGDVAKLRERITFLLQHPEEAARLGENARRMVEGRFTLDHFVERIGSGMKAATAWK